MYGCPNCGSELLYDIKLGRLKCGSCRSSFGVDSIKREKDAEQDLYEIQAFRCPQCGGEIYTNDHTIAGFCSYCGASAVLQQRTEQIKVPFRIFPFTVDKKDCRKRFQEFIAKCSYVPEEYKNPEAEHEFRGIYVPSHSYEAEAGGAYQLKGKTTTYTGKKKGKRHYTVKEWNMNIEASGKVSDINHAASSSFPDEQSEWIQDGIDRGGGRLFAPGFLCGFFADTADVPPEFYEPYARAVAGQQLENQLNDNLAGMEVTRATQEPILHVRHAGDVLKPVWFMSYRNGGRVAYAAIEGRNKNISCDVPVDQKKFTKVSLIIAAILFVVFSLFQDLMFTAKTMLGITALFNMVLCLLWHSNIQKLYRREIEREYKVKKKHRRKHLNNDKWRIALIVVACIIGTPIAIFLFAFIVVIFSDTAYIESSKSLKVFLALVSAAFQLVILLKDMPKRTKLWKNRTRTLPADGICLFVTMLLGVTAYVNPVEDLWYYGAIMAAFGVDILMLLEIIRDYNLSCSRPMPQFELYKGGHNRE